jgi:hypothetical protein
MTHAELQSYADQSVQADRPSEAGRSKRPRSLRQFFRWSRPATSTLPLIVALCVACDKLKKIAPEVGIMKIKITAKNREAIDAALAKADGEATAHTFTSARSVSASARIAEAKLDDLGSPKGPRAG